MNDTRRIYVLGRRELDRDEDETLREFGEALTLAKVQLVTLRTPGVAQAVAHGYTKGGGTVEYMSATTIPDTRDVFLFGDTEYFNNLRQHIPDLDDRDWVLIWPNDLYTFHLNLLKVLEAKGVSTSQLGGGLVGREKSRR